MIQTSLYMKAYDNWYDEGTYTGGSSGRWLGASSTNETLADYNSSHSWVQVCSIGGDFRYVVSGHVGTGTYADSRKYGDTDAGNTVYTHAALTDTPDDGTGDSDDSRGQFSGERHAYDQTNNYSAFFSIDYDSVGSTTDIYIVYPNNPEEISVSCSLGVDVSGGADADIEYQLECAMSVDVSGEFDDLNIYCTLTCSVSNAPQFQVPLDCAMDVDADGSAAPEDGEGDTAETTPDTLDWPAVCPS
jgi:hypothetical protein